MGVIPDGYTKPHFIMKIKDKDKLRMYLFANNLGPLSKYIAKAVKNQMIRDGIISENDKNS